MPGRWEQPVKAVMRAHRSHVIFFHKENIRNGTKKMYFFLEAGKFWLADRL